MNLGRVRTRLLIAAGWLLGAGTATSISLLAVSVLGQGIISSPGQQLTVAAVNRALAREQSGPPAARPVPSATSAPLPDPSPSRLRSAATPPASPGSGSATSGGPEGGGVLLTSSGGSVVAGCGRDGAYLTSWSPEQNFEVASVNRGPAPTVKAVFRAPWTSVTMLVSCHDGTPVAVTHTGGWHHDD